MHVIQTYFKKENRHFTFTDTSALECFKVVKCDVVKVGVADLFVQGVESTALNIYFTCQYAKRTHTLKNVVSVELKKFALIK